MIRFKAFGTPIEIHFGFFAVIALVLSTNTSKYALLGISACCVHEFGHLIFAKLLRVKVNRLTLYGAGMKLNAETFGQPFMTELFLLFAGILFNMLAAVICFAFGNEYLNVFAIVNLLTALFNLLPFDNFDGGRIILLLLKKFFSYNAAEFTELTLRIIGLLCAGLLLGFFMCKGANLSAYLTVIFFLVSSVLSDFT